MLYSKAQLEIDLAHIEEARHLARQMLIEGTLNGFQLGEWLDKLDALERKCKGRLYSTAQYLQERDARKGKKRGKVVQKHEGNAKWKTCTEADYRENMTRRSDQGGKTVRSVDVEGRKRRYEILE